MQPDLITLSVNTDNDDGTTPAVDIDYTRFDTYQNRSIYIADNHTLALRDMLGFYRTFPKQNGNFRGVQKSAVKFTIDQSVPGVDAETTIIHPSLGEVSFNFAVGVSDAHRLEMRMRMVAILLDDAIMDALTGRLLT